MKRALAESQIYKDKLQAKTKSNHMDSYFLKYYGTFHANDTVWVNAKQNIELNWFIYTIVIFLSVDCLGIY